MKTLIQNGADHLVRDGNGKTIAHHAALNGNKICLEFLISSLKIDMSIKNNKGQTVYDVAHKNVSEWMKANDPSRINTNLLLDELCKEEDLDLKAKQKKKLKKQRNKNNKIAKAQIEDQNIPEEEKQNGPNYPIDQQEDEKMSFEA